MLFLFGIIFNQYTKHIEKEADQCAFEFTLTHLNYMQFGISQLSSL